MGQVKIAQEAVEKGKEELERRAHERAERAALSDKLDELSEKVNHAKTFLMKEREKLIGGELPQDAADCMADILPEVARLRSESASPLEEWAPKVEAAYVKGMEAVEVRKSLFLRAMKNRRQPSRREGPCLVSKQKLFDSVHRTQCAEESSQINNVLGCGEIESNSQ